jgi:hypothetical protein
VALNRNRPSFEPGRGLRAGLSVLIGGLAMGALVVMVNYLAATRLNWRHDLTGTRPRLSPLTLTTLAGLTNEVKAIAMFDPGSDLARHVHGLLREYALRSPRLSVQTVDYVRQAALATALKTKYRLGANTGGIVIFDAGDGRFRTVDDGEMSTFDANIAEMLAGRTNEIRRVAFRGEVLFTSALASLSEGVTARACFLQGHGELKPDSDDDARGYSRFARLLAEKNVALSTLTNLGAGLPVEAQLLVIAGATQPLLSTEVNQIERFLGRGGRLLVLLPMDTLNRTTSFERMLQDWGVVLPGQFASDDESSVRGFDIVASRFPSHPITASLSRNDGRVHFLAPRVVAAMPDNRLPPDGPKPRVLATTGPLGRTKSGFEGREFTFVEGRDFTGEIPLAVASEKGGVSGVNASEGTTRVVVIGDVTMFANAPIESVSNRDFAALTVSWLLDRPQALAIGPRPISEYRLSLTPPQMRALRIALLGALPGGALLLGFIVWLRRRS